MHDKAVGSSQSRGGLNDCDDLVRAGQGSGVARFRLPTPPAQGDDEWGRQYAQHAIYPRQQEEGYLLSFWPPECGTVDVTLVGPSSFARASDESRREMIKALDVATRSRVRIRTPPRRDGDNDRPGAA
jgi:hypothetical protein